MAKSSLPPGGRKPVIRDLPALRSALGEKTERQTGENRSAVMYEALQGVISRYQRSKARPFYSMREVADHFEVSVGTALAVYKRLAKEGQLMLVRSSQTLIPPRRARARHEIRGLVSLPTWLPGFLMHIDWRRWLIAVDEELAHHRFAAEPVFYSHEKGAIESLSTRLLARNPDWVLWYLPHPSTRELMLRVADAGTQIMSLENIHSGFPGVSRRVAWWPALDQALQSWRAEREIREVVIPRNTRPSRMIPTLETELAGRSWQVECLPLPAGAHEQAFLQSLLARKRCGIIFDDSLLYAWLCSVAPQAILEVFAKHRVMVISEVLLPCRELPPEIRVDVLRIPVRRSAQTMARDLASGGRLPAQDTICAEWLPQVPLNQAVQRIWQM